VDKVPLGLARLPGAKWLLNMGVLCLLVYPGVLFLSAPFLVSSESGGAAPSFLDHPAPAAYSLIERYDLPAQSYSWLYFVGAALVLVSWIMSLIAWRRRL
jgi:hypothetical protein